MMMRPCVQEINVYCFKNLCDGGAMVLCSPTTSTIPSSILFQLDAIFDVEKRREHGTRLKISLLLDLCI